jgi:hypothetical protein
MRLNHECIRDILMFLEGLELGQTVRATTIAEKLPSYTREEVIYSVKKLFEAGFISGNESEGRHSAGLVKEITWKGHKFIDNIRSSTVWDKVNEESKSIGSISIDILSNIATNIATALITSRLGL